MNPLEATAVFNEVTDWLALLIALLAVAVAAWSAWYTIRVTRQTSDAAIAEGKRTARAETYQRLHETMVTPEAARGRRLLFLSAKAGQFPALGDPGWDEINYSLALYDTLGGYLLQGLVDPHMVLRAWHHPLQEIHEPVTAFMAHRASNGVTQPWGFLINLLAQADNYRCDCPRQPGVEATESSLELSTCVQPSN